MSILHVSGGVYYTNLYVCIYVYMYTYMYICVCVWYDIIAELFSSMLAGEE